MNLPCISIRQPWATFVTRLPDRHRKNIENRSWRTHYRGPLLLHAAQHSRRRDFDEACSFAVEVAGIPRALVPAFDAVERGCIVGAARLVEVVEPVDAQPPWQVPGCFGFVLVGAVTLPRRPLRGALGLFQVTLTPLEAEMLQKAGIL